MFRFLIQYGINDEGQDSVVKGENDSTVIGKRASGKTVSEKSIRFL